MFPALCKYILFSCVKNIDFFTDDKIKPLAFGHTNGIGCSAELKCQNCLPNKGSMKIALLMKAVLLIKPLVIPMVLVAQLN